MHRFALASVFAAVLSFMSFASPSAAQPAAGDLLVASTGASQGVFHTQTRVLGLVPITQTNTLWVPAVTPAYGNNGFVVLTTLSKAMIRYAANGTATQVIPFSGSAPQDLALDQDGAWILPAFGGFYRANGTQVTTIVTRAGNWGAIDRDDDTGDFIVAAVSQGELWRMDRLSRQFTSIATGLGVNVLTGVAYNPVTGAYAVTRVNNRTGLVLVPRGAGLRKFVSITNAGAVAVHPWTGDYWVGTFDGRVIRVTPAGTIVSTRSYGSGYLIRDLAFYGTRNVSLLGTGLRGTTTTIALGFSRSPARNYCAALSFANRPGIAMPDGRLLSLAPDALFFTTVCRDVPGLTQGFVGTLGRTGLAAATITIPSIVPAGTRIYVGAAAVNPSLPGGLDVSNVEVIDVWRLRLPGP